MSLRRPSSRRPSQAAPNSSSIPGGARGPSVFNHVDPGGGETNPRTSPAARRGQQGTCCPLPRLHRVREQSHAVAKHPDKPAAGAWTGSGTPQRAAPAPSGAGAVPQLGEPATPCPRGPAGHPSKTGGSGPRLQRPSSRPPPQPAHLAQLLPLRQRLEGEALVALGAGVERRHVRPGPCSLPRRPGPPLYLTV